MKKSKELKDKIDDFKKELEESELPEEDINEIYSLMKPFYGDIKKDAGKKPAS
jgi:hypothetical protein